LSITCSSRIYPCKTEIWPASDDMTLAKDTQNNFCRLHARTHARVYYAAVITMLHVLPILIFSSVAFYLSSSRCKWILCRGFIEPSLPDAIYLIIKIENTRPPCNVMKITRYILSFCLSFSLLEYYGTRGKCPRYSHARYEMQRLAKQTRSKICG